MIWQRIFGMGNSDSLVLLYVAFNRSAIADCYRKRTFYYYMNQAMSHFWQFGWWNWRNRFFLILSTWMLVGYICGRRPQILQLSWFGICWPKASKCNLFLLLGWYFGYFFPTNAQLCVKKGCVPLKLSTDGAALIYLPCCLSRFPFCYSLILNSEAVSRSNTTWHQLFAK